MKYAVFILSLMILWSCSETDKEPVVSSEPQNDSHKNETIEIANDSLKQEEPFELIMPDTSMLSLKDTTWDVSLSRLYLMEYYGEASELQNIKYQEWDKEKERPCTFSQTFSKGIEYMEDECREGGGIQRLVFPKVNENLMRSFVQLLFEDKTYSWYELNSYGTDDVGCNYLIQHTDSTSILQIYCGC